MPRPLFEIIQHRSTNYRPLRISRSRCKFNERKGDFQVTSEGNSRNRAEIIGGVPVTIYRHIVNRRIYKTSPPLSRLTRLENRYCMLGLEVVGSPRFAPR